MCEEMLNNAYDQEDNKSKFIGKQYTNVKMRNTLKIILKWNVQHCLELFKNNMSMNNSLREL